VIAAERRIDKDERALVLGLPAIIALLALAEALLVAGTIFPVVLIEAGLVFALAGFASTTSDPGQGRLFGLLSLLPLGRLLSVAMSPGDVSPLYRHALIGAPLLVALVLAGRAYDFSCASLGLRRSSVRGQLGILATGVPLGLTAYAILRPAPFSDNGWLQVSLRCLTLLVFVAFLEEFYFRGLLQRAAIDLFGGAGTILAGVMFTLTAIGSMSLGYVAFAAVMGGWFSFAVDRSRCLWGAVGAHALVIAGALLLWPALFG
jgi:membrane protease YdiL (CAAX protease family)